MQDNKFKTSHSYCAGNCSSSDAILLISSFCWPDFAVTCEIKDHVRRTSALSFFLIFFPVKKGIIVSILFNLELLLLFLGIPRYVPNELRCGMISLSQAPAHAAILFFMVQVRISYL